MPEPALSPRAPGCRNLFSSSVTPQCQGAGRPAGARALPRAGDRQVRQVRRPEEGLSSPLGRRARRAGVQYIAKKHPIGAPTPTNSRWQRERRVAGGQTRPTRRPSPVGSGSQSCGRAPSRRHPRSIGAESRRTGLQRDGFQALQRPVRSLRAPEVGSLGAHPQNEQKNQKILRSFSIHAEAFSLSRRLACTPEIPPVEDR